MSLGTIRLSLSILISFALVRLAAGCGGEPPRSDEPTNAREKQLLEQTPKDEPTNAGQWAGWRYSGDRNDCFFVVGKQCYKTQETACAAARCGAAKCTVTGGGPAAVACASAAAPTPAAAPAPAAAPTPTK
jgi:hypothetical protein